MELMRVFWDAAVTLDVDVAPLDEGRRFPLCQPAAPANLFREAGLEAIASPIDIETRFASFEDYWRPFRGIVPVH